MDPGKDTHGTLVPNSGEALGGPTCSAVSSGSSTDAEKLCV